MNGKIQLQIVLHKFLLKISLQCEKKTFGQQLFYIDTCAYREGMGLMFLPLILFHYSTTVCKSILEDTVFCNHVLFRSIDEWTQGKHFWSSIINNLLVRLKSAL